jgi:glycosyltransferase involved in cell wall biosynthesis
MRRLSVCHLITQLELGGAQRNTLYTLAHLDRARFEPSLISGTAGVLDGEASALGIPFTSIPELIRPIAPARDAVALFQLTRALQRLGPDIVHTHSSKAGVLGRVAAALARVPIVIHSVHGWGFHPGQNRLKRGLFIALEKLAAPLTTQFIAVSEANRSTGDACGIAPAPRFEVIYSGVELEKFRRAADSGRLRRELQIDQHTPLVGMIACLKPQKSPIDFVKLAARVAGEVPGAQFVLAGDGELRGEVEAEVRQQNLVSRFHLLGWRNDPETIVGDLDVLVLTSRHEGLPRVCPEAMAAGKPIVATAVDGTPEAVADGINGFVHPFGAVEALAQSVVTLLRDPELRRQFGQAGRRRSIAWDIDEMVRAQERLYLELAAEPVVRPLRIAH